MNILIRTLDFLKSEFEMSKEDETNLLVELVEKSTNLTKEDAVEAIIESHCLSELLSKHMDDEDLISAAISNGLVKEIVEESETAPRILIPSTTPEKLAYYLAYENPEFGTKLFNELIYYKDHGRI